MAGTALLAKMGGMNRRLLALLSLIIAVTLRPAAQGDAGAYLLSRANDLRGNRGLPAYTPHPALNAAAADHARWMAQANRIDHFQDDGSGPRERAVNAGFPSSWVSENIYLGSSASAEAAWNWWLNSQIHFAGLVSPVYDRVGIGSAPGAGRTAFVMVFGNSSGSIAVSSLAGASGAAAAAPPSFVLGRDDAGNIKHEVQPGQTLGDIALIYGYTWGDIDYMLAINGLTRDDQRYMQPGSVFLVPPQDGTFTPTSEPAAASATPAATAQLAPPQSSTPAARADPPTPTGAPTRQIRFYPAADALRAEPSPPARPARESQSAAKLLLLGAAIVAQASVLAGASFTLFRRLH